ncbi:MAG: DNA-processing protein DprA [Patescibacteria group bacterium]
MAESTIYCISKTDARWPNLLHELPIKAQPKQLYIKGELPPSDTLVVAVVGTRRPSNYGKDATTEIVRALARRRIVIASGMALGIDSIAHKTALEENTPTIAILGCGLNPNVLYPKDNLTLAEKIYEHGGALISEYQPDQKPELWTFPQRNRIIAGIAKAIIVIEAGEKSGALITARFATEYGRDVLALPGQIFNSQAQGTNILIKNGATPITSADDILEALGFEIDATKPDENKFVSSDEEKILAVLNEPESLDAIIKQTKLPARTVLASTTLLEIRGMIKNIGGGMYRKI